MFQGNILYLFGSNENKKCMVPQHVLPTLEFKGSVLNLPSLTFLWVFYCLDLSFVPALLLKLLAENLVILCFSLSYF